MPLNGSWTYSIKRLLAAVIATGFEPCPRAVRHGGKTMPTRRASSSIHSRNIGFEGRQFVVMKANRGGALLSSQTIEDVDLRSRFLSLVSP